MERWNIGSSEVKRSHSSPVSEYGVNSSRNPDVVPAEAGNQYLMDLIPGQARNDKMNSIYPDMVRFAKYAFCPLFQSFIIPLFHIKI